MLRISFPLSHPFLYLLLAYLLSLRLETSSPYRSASRRAANGAFFETSAWRIPFHHAVSETSVHHWLWRNGLPVHARQMAHAPDMAHQQCQRLLRASRYKYVTRFQLVTPVVRV